MTPRDRPVNLTTEELARLIKAADPKAFFEEMEPGWFLIDGRYNISALADSISKILSKQRS